MATIQSVSPVALRRPRIRPVLWLSGAVCAMVAVMALAAGIHAVTGDVATPPILKTWIGLTHTLLMVAALALTAAMAFMRKGTQLHRRLGYAWGASLMLGALVSFGMHLINGGLSVPHYFSMGTLVLVPLIAYLGLTHRRRTHNVLVVLYIIFFLVFAGLFAFKPPERALGFLFADMVH
jgi:uncharacterized membrane protein